MQYYTTAFVQSCNEPVVAKLPAIDTSIKTTKNPKNKRDQEKHDNYLPTPVDECEFTFPDQNRQNSEWPSYYPRNGSDSSWYFKTSQDGQANFDNSALGLFEGMLYDDACNGLN
jgi:hypothetical protein